MTTLTPIRRGRCAGMGDWQAQYQALQMSAREAAELIRDSEQMAFAAMSNWPWELDGALAWDDPKMDDIMCDLEDGIIDYEAYRDLLDRLNFQGVGIIEQDCPHATTQEAFEKAKKNLEENTYACSSLEEVKERMSTQGGFAKTMWCGDLECELKMKEEAGVSSRCIPLEQEHLGDVCPVCGKPAKHMVYWGKQY